MTFSHFRTFRSEKLAKKTIREWRKTGTHKVKLVSRRVPQYLGRYYGIKTIQVWMMFVDWESRKFK